MSENSIFLYGTDELAPAPRRLSAGPLSALLDADGGLREIRFGGVEVLRAIAFLVRTPGWGTPNPVLANLDVRLAPQHFGVSYDASVRDGDALLAYRIEIEGAASGQLTARATIAAQSDFSTNRTGFVVLHPLAGVAGQPIGVEHVDGRREQTVLGAQINPAQPLREIRAITTWPAPGITATTRLEGDTFEMEDQRNWSDASFKTYSRPLTLPFPYLLEAGGTRHQSVTLTLTGQAANHQPLPPASADHNSVRLGRAGQGLLPRVGIALDGGQARDALAVSDILRDAAPSLLLAHYDPTRGDGPQELRAIGELAAATGTPVTLEIILAGRDDPLAELASIAAQLADAGLQPGAVAVFPRVDEKSFQPGEPRPASPELAEIYAAARTTFPGVRGGGGTPALFTELNRKHPPAGLLDYVSHGSCPIVHAAGDDAVMQTLETLPWIARSARRIAGPADYHIGPVAIGIRSNPYGDAPSANPDNLRVGLAQVDPRQRGLFGAAWYLGYAATVAGLDVRELVLAGGIGPFGIVYSPQPFAQPWYDGLAQPSVYPVFHVVAELAAAAGSPLVELEVADRSRLAALAWLVDGQPRLALANLDATAQTVRLAGWPAGPLRGRLLDGASFERAALDWRGFRAERQILATTGEVTLGAYAIALIGDPA